MVSTKGRSAVAMTDDEVTSYLASELKVQVASIGADGAPHLTTLFYVVHDGKIAFWTYEKSQKVRNLDRDARITCLVESGADYFELKGVSVQGTAQVIRDKDRIREIGTKVVVAMSGVDTFEELGDVGHDIVERQVQKRVAIVVTPTKVASWDHSKMKSPPGAPG